VAGVSVTPRTDLETQLYRPVKRHLEQLGFAVKGEVGGCDLVGIRNDDRVMIIGELKLRFNLDLLLQGVDRASACDEVWLAVRTGSGRQDRTADPRVRKLCRLLGFGLLGVTAAGKVDALVAPGPWRPRRDAKRRSRLMDEHRRRKGDPTLGGTTRAPTVTAYRQQALECAEAISAEPRRPRDLKAKLPDAPKILLHNVYGWFERVERGVYALTDEGRTALERSRQRSPGPPGDRSTSGLLLRFEDVSLEG
jgi:hypothetical protein